MSSLSLSTLFGTVCLGFCLYFLLDSACVRETLSDEYVICRESHFGNVSDNLSFAKQIEIYC